MLRDSLDRQVNRLRSEKYETKLLLQNLIKANEPYFFQEHELLPLSSDDFNKNKAIHFVQKEKEFILQVKQLKKAAKIEFQDKAKLIEVFMKDGKSKVQKFGITGFVTGGCDVVFALCFIDSEKKSHSKTFCIEELIDLSEFSQLEISSITFSIYISGSGMLHLFHAKLMGSYKSAITENSKLARPKKKLNEFRVGFIADEFTTSCFDHEFQLVKITPENWVQEFKRNGIDFFFCESAWVGNNGAWKNRVGTSNNRNHNMLLKLVYWCKEHHIPTVFWNKEDPFHFDAFVRTAKHFDYVFTTDFESVQLYKEQGCNEVHCLPFAAQPKIHNPIEYFLRKDKVVFAGAYYGDKFPERTSAMKKLVDSSLKYGIEIFDRNYYLPKSPNQFPKEYRPYIIGNLKQNEIDRAYKGYKIALNVNSITESPTMFARGVFEIMASNTPIISSHSKGIQAMFGDLVTATDDEVKIQESLSLYFNDEQHYRKNRLLNLRKVLEEHTYSNRVEELLKIINLPYEKEEEFVTLIGIVKSTEDFDKIKAIYDGQSIRQKKLILLIDCFDGYLDIFNENNNSEIKTFLIDYCHNYFSINDLVETNYIAPIHLDHFYGENYLRDLLLATKYTNECVITKGKENSYTYVNECKIDEAMICKKATRFMNPIEFIKLLEEKASISHFSKAGINFFEIDEFNFYRDVWNQENSDELIKNVSL